VSLHHTKTLIVGAGANGGYLAARMIEKGVDISMLTRPARFEHLLCRGLHVSSRFGRFGKPAPALVSAEIKSKYDLVIFACRSHRLVEAVNQAAIAVGPATIILSLVDGGPHLPFFTGKFPKNTVFEGMLEGRLFMDADQIIRHREPETRIQIGMRSPGDAVAMRIVQLLQGRGMIASAVEDLLPKIWTRSIFLAAGVGAAAIVDQPVRDALRCRSGDIHFGFMCDEGRGVAKRAAVAVSKDMLRDYRVGLGLEGEPIPSPPKITDRDGAGQEALFLLEQLIERAMRLGASHLSLKMALNAAKKRVSHAA
jgi:2-dehydropantoate 2-reductase